MPYGIFSLATNCPSINRHELTYQLISLIASANTHPLLAGRYRLILEDSRVIELVSLSQQLTYLAFLFGNPTRSTNRDLMQSHLRMAEERQCRLSLPLKAAMLEPTATPIASRFRQGALGDDYSNPYETLPPIWTIAVFDSDNVGHMDACSSALVVWYQDQWGLPTLPVHKQLQQLDWTEYAQDWTW